MELQILGRDSSYNVQKVLWLAAELQLPFEHIQFGGKYGGLDNPTFHALNPMQRVPVLVDAGATVWESNSILRYLLNQYAKGPWRCTDPLAQSKYERWMDWELCKLEPAFYGVFWGYYRTPLAQRDTPAIQQAVIDCEQCLVVLARQLDNKAFLVGDQPTLADICAGVYLYRLAEIDLPISFPKKIQSWYKRLQTRPAYQQWVMRDFSELNGRLAF